MSLRIAVFASGGGTNLQSLLDHFNGTTDRGARITLVISDRADVGALRRAADAGVLTRVVPVKGKSADEVADDTLAALRADGIDVIALSGYLRLVPPAVIQAYGDRIVNIHPALLPAFGGAGMYGRRVHQAVIDACCMVTGATVHYVDEHYDEGGIIAQWPVPVLPGDTADSLAARVLRIEHMIYPLALEAVIHRLARADRAAAGVDDLNADAVRAGAVHAGAVDADAMRRGQLAFSLVADTEDDRHRILTLITN